MTRKRSHANQDGVKLLPLRRGYRFAVLGLVIGACHSGETRDLLGVGQPPGDDGGDSGSDAAVGGTSGTGGDSSQHPNAGTGGLDASYPDGGTSGIDAGDADIEDPYDAEAGSGGEAGPTCGDGNTDLALDEECDDGNDQHSDGCETDCKKTRITQVALGREFTCALSNGGGVKCWGRDTFGALGRGTSGLDVPNPSQIDIIDFGTTRRVTQIVASWYHACALFDDGRARCWGRNDAGQLGIGNQLDYGDGPPERLNALGDLALDHIKSITVSEMNTCVISDIAGANNLYCWGENARGELGIGTTNSRDTPSTTFPAVLSGTPAQTTLGYRSPCTILNGGSVRCWGSYLAGSLGVGLIDFYVGNGIGDGNGLGELPNDPTLDVKALPGAATAVVGQYYTRCALVSDDLYCWGRNPTGQVGYPVATVGTEVWETPGRLNLGDVPVVQADLANSHGCAIDADGVARCWGNTFDSGCLGYPGVDYVGYYREPELDYLIMSGRADGGTPDAAVPGAEDLPLGAVDVGDFDETPGLDPIESIWVGYRSTCAIMKTGSMRCWGQNNYNRLGYGIDVPNVGYVKSPAGTYEDVGFPDVNVFGPPPTP